MATKLPHYCSCIHSPHSVVSMKDAHIYVLTESLDLSVCHLSLTLLLGVIQEDGNHLA